MGRAYAFQSVGQDCIYLRLKELNFPADAKMHITTFTQKCKYWLKYKRGDARSTFNR